MIGLIENLIEILDKVDDFRIYPSLVIERECIKVIINTELMYDDDIKNFNEKLDRKDSSPNNLYLFQKKVQDFLVDNCMEAK